MTQIRDELLFGCMLLYKMNIMGCCTIVPIIVLGQVVIESGRATGVDVIRSGQPAVKMKANKEVILSAGAIESPRTLMLSGIGPAEHLDKVCPASCSFLSLTRSVQPLVLSSP